VGILGSVFLNIEIAGTGGCAFRRMYRRSWRRTPRCSTIRTCRGDRPAGRGDRRLGVAGARGDAGGGARALGAPRSGCARAPRFEQGDLAALEPEGRRRAPSRRAVAAVERGRDALRPLPDRIAEVGAREARLFAVLERIAPPAPSPGGKAKKAAGRAGR